RHGIAEPARSDRHDGRARVRGARRSGEALADWTRGRRVGPFPFLRGGDRASVRRVLSRDARRAHDLGGSRQVGVLLTPIVSKETLTLEALRGKRLAVDGNAELYQFLALIRLRDGTPLRDSKGRIPSHLSGLFYRTTRLIPDHALRLVFVFDGAPPPRKAREIAERRATRQRYEEARAAALERGDLDRKGV